VAHTVIIQINQVDALIKLFKAFLSFITFHLINWFSTSRWSPLSSFDWSTIRLVPWTSMGQRLELASNTLHNQVHAWKIARACFLYYLLKVYNTTSSRVNSQYLGSDNPSEDAAQTIH
ncbi:hypothetical protein ACJX0J_024129, partial [Zea mays]